VSLVGDDRIAPFGDLRLPGLGFGALLFGGRIQVVRPGCPQQAAQHKGKFLQRGHHDLGAVDQCRGQLAGVLVNGLDHALGMLDLVNGILQLPVQHLAVGDHDHAVVDLLVLRRVQAGQPVGEPGDGVSLAAASRMLDQIVAAGPLLARAGHLLAHGIQLMVARKNHILPCHQALPALAVVDLDIVLFHKQKVAQNI